MTTEGIEAVFLETHNWGKAAKFFQALGFELGIRDPTMPPASSETATVRTSSSPRFPRRPGAPAMQLVLKVSRRRRLPPRSSPSRWSPRFEDTHFGGTRAMTVRDPDGRLWSLQAPANR